MRRNAAVALVIGYLATYHPLFVEELTLIERTTGTVGLGICFLMLYTALLKEKEIKKHEISRKVSKSAGRSNH